MRFTVWVNTGIAVNTAGIQETPIGVGNVGYPVIGHIHIFCGFGNYPDPSSKVKEINLVILLDPFVVYVIPVFPGPGKRPIPEFALDLGAVLIGILLHDSNISPVKS